MLKFVSFVLALLASCAIAMAQSAPSNPAMTYGMVPTVGQWNSWFEQKQDTLGYVPVNRNGDTMQGKLIVAASTSSTAGFNLPPGTAPDAPVNGDVWMTNEGMFAQVGGVTIGPIRNGNVAGPGTSVVGNLPVFGSTDGSVLADSGRSPPSGVIVGTTDIQTLTNKSIDGGQITGTVANATTATTATAAGNITGIVSVANGGTGANNSSAAANTVFAAPNGSSGAPTMRSLVSADYPLAALKANNLSDLASAATSRVNLGFANSAGDDVTNAAGTHFIAGCKSIEAFGGVGDGVTDNLAAWTSVVGSFGTGDVCVKFGLGTYFFSGTAVANPGAGHTIRIYGMGKTVSHLLWTSNVNGMHLTLGNTQTVDVSGLDFETGIINTNTALTIDSSSCGIGNKYASHLSDLAFRGQGSFVTSFYWTRELVATDLSFVNVTDDDFFGDPTHTVGLIYQSSNPPTCVSVVANVARANFINDNIGFLYGNGAQGVTIAQSNFTNGTIGISLPGTSTGTAQLAVTNSQFNTTTDQISIAGNIAGVQIANNVFTVPPGHDGIVIGNATTVWYTIVGNIFENTVSAGGVGIEPIQNGSLSGGTITGNVFYQLGTGVALHAGSSHWTVASNSYNTVTTPVSNSCTTACLVGVATP